MEFLIYFIMGLVSGIFGLGLMVFLTKNDIKNPETEKENYEPSEFHKKTSEHLDELLNEFKKR